MKLGRRSKPGSVAVFPLSAFLHVGQFIHAGALVFDKKGKLMPGVSPSSWASDNTAIATVDQNGLVTGVAAGSCGVTALLDKLTSNIVAVTVTDVPASISVTPGSISVAVGETVQLTAVVTDAQGNPI